MRWWIGCLVVLFCCCLSATADEPNKVPKNERVAKALKEGLKYPSDNIKEIAAGGGIRLEATSGIKPDAAEVGTYSNVVVVVCPSEEIAQTIFMPGFTAVQPDPKSPTADAQQDVLGAKGWCSSDDNTLVNKYTSVEAIGRFMCGDLVVLVIMGDRYDKPLPLSAFEPGDPDLGAKSQEWSKALAAAHVRMRESLRKRLVEVHQALMDHDACVPAAPEIVLDRVQAPRFSAIRIKGSRFRSTTDAREPEHVNILWNGKELFRIDQVADDGTLSYVKGMPKETDQWIWVPDAAPFGSNEVQAVEGKSGRKSNIVKVDVTQMTWRQIVDNFDSVASRYLKEIPANPGCGSGAWWNIRSIIPPETSKYRCGWYQGEVLKFLDSIRFAPDVEVRATMDGIDYGPIFSGLEKTIGGGVGAAHAWVAVWPHGSALPQGGLADDESKAWESRGLAFDPWYQQKPMIYKVSATSGGWAESSAYADRWNKWRTGIYSLATPNPQIPDCPHRNQYPVSGAVYYMNAYKGLVVPPGFDAPKPSPKALLMECPVTLEFRDAEGRRAGRNADGSIFSDIPKAQIYCDARGEGDYLWSAALPEGPIDVSITGMGDGKFVLTTHVKGGKVMKYPEVTTSKGAVSTVRLDDSPEPDPIKTDKGETVLPAETSLPAVPNDPGSSTAGPTGATPGTGGTGTSATGGESGTAAGTGTTNATTTAGSNAGGVSGGGVGTGSPATLVGATKLKVSRIAIFRRLSQFKSGETQRGITSMKMSGNGKTIAVGSYSGAFTMRPDSPDVQVLSTGRTECIDVSYDGGTVAWFESAPQPALFVSGSNGTGKLKMPGGWNATQAIRITADGSKLFVLNPEKGGIVVVPTDGSDIKRIVSTEAACKLVEADVNGNHWRGKLSISDDGSRLVSEVLWDIIACNGDGTGLRRITRYKQFTTRGIALSPDGRVIAHLAYEGGDRPTELRFTGFDGSPISAFVKHGEESFFPTLTGDGKWVLGSWGVRFWSIDAKTHWDPLDIGHGPLPRARGVSGDHAGRIAAFITEADGSDQIAIADFSPQSFVGTPAITDITVFPVFAPTDGTSSVQVTAKVSSGDLALVGCAFLWNGARIVGDAISYQMFDDLQAGDETKGDGIFTTNQLVLHPVNGKPREPGPIGVRVFAFDKSGSLTVVDLEGVSARSP